jgi:hypothetical protein
MEYRAGIAALPLSRHWDDSEALRC